LRVGDKEFPSLAHVLEKLFHVLADQTLGESFDCMTDLAKTVRK
jgi:hypothetical protein